MDSAVMHRACIAIAAAGHLVHCRSLMYRRYTEVHSHLQSCFYNIKGVQQQDCRRASNTTSNQVLPALPLL